MAIARYYDASKNLEERAAKLAGGGVESPRVIEKEKIVLKEVVVYRDALPRPGRSARIVAFVVGAVGVAALGSGIAFDAYGNARGAMGIDAAHYRNDAALGIWGTYNFLLGHYYWEKEVRLALEEGLAKASGKPWKEMVASLLEHSAAMVEKFGGSSDEDEDEEGDEEGGAEEDGNE